MFHENFQDDFTTLDATDDAKQIMKAVREITQARTCNLTLVFLTDIFKGSAIKKIRDAGMNITFSYFYRVQLIITFIVHS